MEGRCFSSKEYKKKKLKKLKKIKKQTREEEDKAKTKEIDPHALIFPQKDCSVSTLSYILPIQHQRQWMWWNE